MCRSVLNHKTLCDWDDIINVDRNKKVITQLSSNNKIKLCNVKVSLVVHLSTAQVQ